MASGLRRGLIYAVVAVSALAAGVLSRSLDRDRVPPQSASPGAEGGEAILGLNLPDLQGRNLALSQFKGQVLVVNFWATWCEPCKEEIPEFAKIHGKFSEKGVTLLGIALDEREQVAAFVDQYRIPYLVLIAPLDAIEVSRKAGNPKAALPFTAILDRQGRVVSSHLGGLDQARLEAAISPLI